MEFIKTAIEGVIIVKPQIFEDERGYFFESYSEQKFEEAGIATKFVQDNQSKSQKNVLRGLHFQSPPHAQAKLVGVVKGAVLDVAVDIRKGSPTFGKYVAEELTEENKTMLFIAEGLAHGFLVLRDDTIFSYKCSSFYNKASEGSLVWNDPALAINWGIKHPIMSAKDLAAPRLDQIFNNDYDFKK